MGHKMNAKQLAEILLQTPEAEVFAYDADADLELPVTGLVGNSNKQYIQTDNITD